MFAGTYNTSAASVNASVASGPATGRDTIVEPQRMHSALVPGASSLDALVQAGRSRRE